MELTKDEAVRLHRELWDWLSKNPEENKRDWPGWKDINLYPVNECICCMFTVYPDMYRVIKCDKCLLKWPGGHCGHIFEPWEESNNIEERTRLAEQIRDLPVRGESA